MVLLRKDFNDIHADAVLRRVNDFNDHWAAVYKAKDYSAGQPAMKEFVAELEQFKQEAKAPGGEFNDTLLAAANEEGVRPITRWAGSVFLADPYDLTANLFPLVWRAKARQNLLRIILALEPYRHEHSQYPETLNALMPDILPELPEDAFTGQPPIYESQDDSYKLYSVGPNLTNDGSDDDDVKFE